MSFDVYVWHESTPITPETARAKLEQWSGDEAHPFSANSAVPLMRDALLERFPALESLPEEDIDTLGVWSMTPAPSDSILALSCVWSRADELYAAVTTMAAEYGLVCYEPGDHVLNPNAPGYRATFTLTSAGLPNVPHPDAKRLDRVARQLGDKSYYAILERADGWYVQVGYGGTAGTGPGTYALEYREGSMERHFRSDTTDLTEVIRFLQEFLAGDETWKRRHTWQPLFL